MDVKQRNDGIWIMFSKDLSGPTILSRAQAADPEDLSYRESYNCPVFLLKTFWIICFSPPHHQYSSQDHPHLLPVFQNSLWTGCPPSRHSCPPLLCSKHVQHLAASEFCFLPVDILFFHKSGLKVNCSGKSLLTAPAPRNSFLELHLSGFCHHLPSSV